jgi:4'-phosphopantetheinyl transferase
VFSGNLRQFEVRSGAALEECLDGAGVSVWLARLDVSASTLRDLAACISSEERQRTAHLHRPLDRQRFVAARGWLRHLLASQLGCAPTDVRFVTGEHGKPRLASDDLCFSAARSAGVALYATSPTVEVGVDVEAIRPMPDIDRIAARFFSPTEQRAIAELSPAHRLAAFFQCWTCKEAYVKGVGTGLDFPLHAVDVWADASQRATVDGWSVCQVQVLPGFAGAVAAADLDEWVVNPARAAKDFTGREYLAQKRRLS